MSLGVDELINILENSSLEERQQIIEQLAKSENDIVELLISILNKDNARQSWLAASGLAYIEDDRVVPSLLAALVNVNDAVKSMLLEILGDLGDQQAIHPLIDMLNSKNVVVQMATVQALAKIGDRRSVTPLMAALEYTESSSLRYTIIEALGVLGDSQAIELIQRYESDENHHVRRRVERALHKLTAKK